jgi:hypothetical protein
VKQLTLSFAKPRGCQRIPLEQRFWPKVTIRDTTGKAEITRQPKRGGLRLQQSGAL